MSIRNLKYCTVFIIAFLISACKSTKSITTVDSDMYQPLPKALLWEITGKQLKEPSYLYGTIHMIGKDDFFWPEGTLTAIDDADQIAFEVDLDEMMDMGAQMNMLTKAFMKDDVTLDQLLSEEEYKKVSDHFDGMGLPMFMLNKIKPLFLTVFASGDIEMGDLQGGGSVKSYEMEIYEIANGASKTVEGLESMDYQMSIFDSIPYKEQAQMLAESIDSYDTDDDQFKIMVDGYKAQDIDGMISMMQEEEMGVGEYEDMLLNDRNANWIPVIEGLLSENQTFIAVGAGHLAGPKGVIHLLRKAGFTMKPLSHTAK